MVVRESQQQESNTMSDQDPEPVDTSVQMEEVMKLFESRTSQALSDRFEADPEDVCKQINDVCCNFLLDDD